MSRARVLAAALAGPLLLSGCETSTKLADLLGANKSDDPSATASVPDPASAKDDATGAKDNATGAKDDATGAIGSKAPPNESGLLGADPYDDLNTGKKLYRSANFGLAERHFRRAVETRPKDAEAWVGLAACYDQLRRFELADRAYNQAMALIGPTPELLNNIGYSYMLRSDYARARTTLIRAREKDPANPYILSNLETVEKALRKRKGIQQK